MSSFEAEVDFPDLSGVIWSISVGIWMAEL